MQPAPLIFSSADGVTARLRVPGGHLSPDTWNILADLAELGDGQLHLTARGNLQIRGIDDEARFRRLAQEAGFRAGATILASPLARRQHLVEELDTRLRGHELPQRLLLGVDDGSGDILSQSPDLGLQLTDPTGSQAVLIQAGQLSGSARDLSLIVDQVVATASQVTPAEQAEQDPAAMPPRVPVGWLPAGDGSISLGAGLRFGVLEATVARMLAVIGVDSTITPWASLVIHDLSESIAEQVVRVLAPLGLIFDENSPWLRVTACVGKPGCRHGLSATRIDAGQAVAAGVTGRVHFVGCEKNCGRPNGPHTLYQASSEGEYEVY